MEWGIAKPYTNETRRDELHANDSCSGCSLTLRVANQDQTLDAF
jgi:hypothetical protein